jgi:pSer/pThr/pTyr-binding forkhead associated (FHA) protein
VENHVVVPTSLVDASLFQRISRNHCTLEKSLENGEISLISHSGNGTYVDGQRVLNQKVFRVYHGAVIALCSAASRASFTLYDNFHRHFDQQYFQLRNNYLFMSVMAGG